MNLEQLSLIAKGLGGPPKEKEKAPTENTILRQTLKMKEKGSMGIVSQYMQEQQKQQRENKPQEEFILVPADIVNKYDGQEKAASDDDDLLLDENIMLANLKQQLKSQVEAKIPFTQKVVDAATVVKNKVVQKYDEYKKFKKGSKFFSYDTAGFDNFENEIGIPPKKVVGGFNKFKKMLKIFIGIVLFGSLLAKYLSILGSEKSQSLKYKLHTNLTYPIGDVPRLLAAHQFIFFGKEEIEDRIKCKIYNSQDECKEIEVQKCTAKGNTTELFQDCMISFNSKLGLNTTEFCVSHYAKPEMKIDSLNQSMPYYWERLHGCYAQSGIPKGRAFCDDMMKYQVPAWDKDNLFNCYRRHNVDFGKEYCEYIFASMDPDDEQSKKTLKQCLGSQGVTSEEEQCNEKHPGNSRRNIQDRIDCYDKFKLRSIEICNTKQYLYFWPPITARYCYQDAGYANLDKQYCDDYYPLREQLDQRYECYQILGFDYLKKDRVYCELKYDDIEQVFNCLLTEIDHEGFNPYTSLGGDYCYSQFKWFDQYKELYQCLSDQGLRKDSTICNMEENYNIFQTERDFEGPELQKKLKDISDQKWVCQQPFFDPSNQLDWESSINCTFQTKILETEGGDQQVTYALDDTSLMTPKPVNIENTGDLTIIQQSFFVGGGIRFQLQHQNEDEASFLLFGNYPDLEQFDKAQQERLKDLPLNDQEFFAGCHKYGKLMLLNNTKKDFLHSSSETANTRRLLKEKLSHPSQRRRVLQPSVHQGGSLVPNIPDDFGSSFNFVDEREYNDKAVSLIQQGAKIDYAVGEWYFSHANQLELEFKETKEKYSVTFDQEQNTVSITINKDPENRFKLSFKDGEYPKVEIVQNWGQNIQDKMFTYMLEGSLKPQMNCHFAEINSEVKEWKYSFGQERQIQVIELFNFENGAQGSLLQDALIYIGDTLCARINPDPPLNEVLRIKCQDEKEVPKNIFDKDFSQEDKYLGTVGDSIRIVPERQGLLSICDIKVFARELPVAPANSSVQYCKDWRAQCSNLPFAWDQDNCLERFGQKKTAQSCLNLQSSQVKEEEPKFYYPLVNKYKCLYNYLGNFDRVQLDNEVYDCLGQHYFYQMEKCLEQYEKSYSSIEFSGYPNLLSRYGSVGEDLVKLLEQQRKEQRLKDGAEQQRLLGGLQVPLVELQINFTTSMIESYLCNNKTSMFFLTNPFNDGDISENHQNEIILGMNCEVFLWEDQTVQVGEKFRWVTHYYLDQEPPITNNVSDHLSAIKNSLFINGTDLNEQYFQVEFDKQLQYMTLQKTELYIREQDPQAEKVEIPLMEGEGDKFDEFVASASSVLLVSSHESMIGVEQVEDTTLDALPRTNNYKGMPKKNGYTFYDLFPLQFENVVDRIILVFQCLTDRLSERMTDEEMSVSKFKMKVSLRVSFTEEKFTFLYYNLMDLVSEVGGLGGAINGSMGQLAFILMMLFVADMVMVIKKKSKQEKRLHNIALIGEKLPFYKMCVLWRINAANKQMAELMLQSSDEKEIEELQNEIDKRRDHLFRIKKLIQDRKIEDTQKIYSEDLRKEDQACQPPPSGNLIEAEYVNCGCFVYTYKEAVERNPDEMIDEQEEDMLMIEKEYKQEFKDSYVRQQKDLFEELDVTKKILNERTKYPFMFIVELVKKRVSFFGIYALCDQLELTMEKINFLKKELDQKSRVLVYQQNQLRENYQYLAENMVDPDSMFVEENQNYGQTAGQKMMSKIALGLRMKLKQ